MKLYSKTILVCLGAACLLASPSKTFAFAMLGPVQPWMQATNGVIRADDIGGPMEIGSGYRWNVPVLTYGFDQSFLDYFGTNGVADVEGAMEIFNSLPPASQIELMDYSTDSQQMNNVAASQLLLDLKSKTLQLLLEHMGLAQPTRYIFAIGQWTNALCPPPYQPSAENGPINWGEWAIPDFIYLKNFDPQTLQASHYVNDVLYYGYIIRYVIPNSTLTQNYVYPVSVDPFVNSYTAVADIYDLHVGGHYIGLTRDDVGGLAYLYSTNRVNHEQLLAGVVGSGTNAGAFVNGAWRPGVDKVTFIPHPVDFVSGIFLPATNIFTDRYLTNGMVHSQQLARIVLQPDFLFRAGDVKPAVPDFPYFDRTGTTNWLNNAAANGNTNLAGPGVIQPPVQIVFNKLGPSFYQFADQPVYEHANYWGSFDSSTNPPIVYPVQPTNTVEMTVRLWLTPKRGWAQSFDWQPSGLPGTVFALQTSTNLTSWTTLITTTNNGSVSTFFATFPTGSQRFYRLVPQ